MDQGKRRARRSAYGLLGTLLIEGLDREGWTALATLPGLSDWRGEPDQLDERAAEHYEQVGRELLPFAGVYIGADGLVGGGRPAEVVRAAHAVVGLSCPDEPAPDHLGQILRVLSTLADAEIDAHEHDDQDDARTLGYWQRRVLDEAMLPWMPPLLAALGGQTPTVFTHAIELAVGVAMQHRAEDAALPRVVAKIDDHDDSEALLDRPGTSLSTVASILSTPARCGVYLARDDMRALARRCELPRGFGPRQGMLERLLRGAAEYESIPRLCHQLDQVWVERDGVYASLLEEPGLGVHVPAWRRRVAATRRMLARLSAAVGSNRSVSVPAPEGPCNRLEVGVS